MKELLESLELLKSKVLSADRNELMALVSLAQSFAEKLEQKKDDLTVADLILACVQEKDRSVEEIRRRVFFMLRDGIIDSELLKLFLAQRLELKSDGSMFADQYSELLKSDCIVGKGTAWQPSTKTVRHRHEVMKGDLP